MLRRTKHQPLRLITELSIAPVLSVVLVLLLAFMISGPLLQGSSATTTISAAEPPENIAKLTVDKRQSMWLEGSAIERADLKDALSNLVKAKPGTGVLVQIDPAVPVQGLVELMTTLREIGIRKTAVKTLEK